MSPTWCSFDWRVGPLTLNSAPRWRRTGKFLNCSQSFLPVSARETKKVLLDHKIADIVLSRANLIISLSISTRISVTCWTLFSSTFSLASSLSYLVSFHIPHFNETSVVLLVLIYSQYELSRNTSKKWLHRLIFKSSSLHVHVHVFATIILSLEQSFPARLHCIN